MVRVQEVQLVTFELQPKQATVEQRQVLAALRVYPAKQDVQVLSEIEQVAQVTEQTEQEPLFR